MSIGVFLAYLFLAAFLCFILLCANGYSMYRVDYDANGGTDSKSFLVSSRSNEPVLRSPSYLGIHREGYKFVGWALQADTTKTYPPGTFYKPIHNYHFYAIWQPADSVAA